MFYLSGDWPGLFGHQPRQRDNGAQTFVRRERRQEISHIESDTTASAKTVCKESKRPVADAGCSVEPPRPAAQAAGAARRAAADPLGYGDCKAALRAPDNLVRQMLGRGARAQ